MVRVAEGPSSAALPQISKIRLIVGYEGIKSVCDDPTLDLNKVCLRFYLNCQRMFIAPRENITVFLYKYSPKVHTRSSNPSILVNDKL
jgi:hypothetical protein